MCQMAIIMFTLSETKFFAIYNVENHFQIRGLVAELHVFLNMVVQYSALLTKLDLNVEDFYVKTIGIIFFDHETRKSGLFLCYRLKINDFLSS